MSISNHLPAPPVLCLGEVLLDWVCLDRTLDLQQATQFTKAPGGAPANVAVGLAKLGYPVCFMGGLSTDIFGTYLQEVLSGYGVNMALSPLVPLSNTRHAYVLTDEYGNRVFKGFTTVACADSMMSVEHLETVLNKALPVSGNVLQQASFIYLGSVLQSSPVTRATLSWVLDSVASQDQTVLVYDPNYRASLWADSQEAFDIIVHTASRVNVVKLSDDEITAITGHPIIEEAAHAFYRQVPSLQLLIVTCGPSGSFFMNAQGHGFVSSYKLNSVEMTGAGDGFVAGLIGGLYEVLTEASAEGHNRQKISQLLPQQLEKILRRANAVGALATLKPGAMASLPLKSELDHFLQSSLASS